MINVRKTTLCISAMIAAIFGSLLIVQDTRALKNDGDDRPLMEISLLQGLYNCYTNTDPEYLSSSIKLGSFASDFLYQFSSGLTRGSKGYVRVPTGVAGSGITTTKDADQLTCREIFTGKKSWGRTLVTGVGNEPFTGGSLEDKAKFYGYEYDEASSTTGNNGAEVRIDLTRDYSSYSSSQAKIVSSASSLNCKGDNNGNGTYNISMCSGYQIFTYPTDFTAEIDAWLQDVLTADTDRWEYLVYGEGFPYDFDDTTTTVDDIAKRWLVIMGTDNSDSRVQRLYAYSNVNIANNFLGAHGGEIGYDAEPVKVSGTSFDNAVVNFIKDSVNTQVMYSFSRYVLYGRDDIKVTANSTSVSGSSDQNSFWRFSGDDRVSAAKIAARNLAKQINGGTEPYYVSPNGRAAWYNAYIYQLYYRYLQKYGVITTGHVYDCSKDKPSEGWYFKNKSTEWCKISIPSGVDIYGTEVNIVSDDKYNLEPGKLVNVLEWFQQDTSYQGLSSSDYAEVEVTSGDDPIDDVVDPNQPPETDPGSNSNTNTSSCAGLNAAGSLSWILCPILDLAGKATNWLYENAVEPFLKTEASFLDTSSGTYTAWGLFQNIANVFSIVLLLVVIFSQVTGVGIDNYGIKKILPKFVIAVVLINLSFIICQLAVDVSNIVGNGIKTLMDNMGETVTIGAIYADNVNDASAVGATIGTAGVITALIGIMIAFPGIPAAIGAAALPFLPGILLALFGAVIGMLLGVLILFLLLTIRKIAVVILVVLAPLAFAAYMLPNTKSLFDKWLKFLKNMLLMYPICGLVIGGGNLAGKIILTSGMDDKGNLSFLMALAGMLASVVPFFFIPKLLKGSMDAFGNIGSKMSNFGKNMGGKVKGLAAGSDLAKDMQRRATMARNQKVFDRYKHLEDSGKKLSSYQKRRMNNARLAFNNAAREDIAVAAGGAMLKENTTAYDAALAMQESTVSKQELDDQIVAMANDTDNYDVKNMSSKLTKLLSSPTELSHEDEVMMKALMRQLTTKGGFGKKELVVALSGASNATRVQAAKFMSKDGDVAAAVNKNMMVAQYMREVNNGEVSGGQTFAEWQSKNASRVLSQVITNDTDFVNQSASAVKSQVGLLSDERLSAIVNNERVMDTADSKVRDAIIAAAKARNMSVPVRYGGSADPQTHIDNPVPVQAPTGDSTTLNVQGGSGAAGKPVDVKIEQPAPKIHVDQVVEQMNNGSRERMQTQGGIILNESPEVQRQLEQEFRQRKDEADRRNDRGGGGIILPS